MKFNIKYDQLVDAAYIKLSEAKIAKTVEKSDLIIVDYDKRGRICGVELLNVSTHFKSCLKKKSLAFP
jgi:uncharacterized protein YuzE